LAASRKADADEAERSDENAKRQISIDEIGKGGIQLGDLPY
jgi:hypothetical protein